MPYGTLKADTLTYYTATGDVNLAISGIAISGSPLISGVSGVFTTSVSGATVTGDAGQFTTITGGTAQFTNITGVSGTFTSRISGATVTGTSGQFTTITATTGVFTTSISGATISGDVGLFTTISGSQGVFNSGLSIPSGTAASPSISFNGDPNTGLYSTGADAVAISTGGSGRLFVDASGNVSVGSSSAFATSAGRGNITLNGSTDSLLAFGNAGLISAYLLSNSSELTILASGARNQTFYTNNTERLRITSAGLVGVGTSSPSHKVQVNIAPTGTNYDGISLVDPSVGVVLGLYKTGPSYSFGGVGSNQSWIYANTGDLNITGDGSGVIKFQGLSGANRMVIDSSGRVGIGTSTAFGQGGLTIAPNYSQGSPSIYFNRATTTNESIAAYFANADVNVGWLSYTNSLIKLNGVSSLQLATGSGGTAALTVDSSQRVGIGTTSPSSLLHVTGGSGQLVELGTGNSLRIGGFGTGNCYVKGNETTVSFGNVNAGNTAFLTGDTERARIDSSGRLLVGTSTSRGNFFNNASGTNPGFQLEGSAFTNRIASITSCSNTNNEDAAGLILARQNSGSVGGNTIVSNNNSLALLSFQGSDGSELVEAARIETFVDGTPGANDMPGRLVFSTTADGASSPTERVRISQNGVVTVKNGAVAEIGTLTDGATVTPDFAANCNFTLTISGNRTLANPTNITAGQTGSIFIIQGTGSNALSWGSYWDFAGGTAPTLSTASGAVDRVDYVVRTSTSIHTVFTANYS